MPTPPRLLVLDTSTPRAALAVTGAGPAPAVARTDPAARHGRTLLPAVRDLLAAAGLAPSDLEGVVVGLGPGSYTGLRVGVTAAKTLAYALRLPLAGFDSLEAVARNAPADATAVAVVADAQRGDVYAADFARTQPGGPLERLAPTRVVSLADWAAALPAGVVVLGPAAAHERVVAALPPRATRPDDAPDSDTPAPSRILTLALEVWETGRREDPWLLEPVYLRRSAAEEQWDRKAAKL